MRSFPLKKANDLGQAKALSGHLATQMMLSKVSTHLLQADSENHHHQFTTVTRLLGTFCQAEGGDHFFIRTLKTPQNKASSKTMISLKDQSGHQVGCILGESIMETWYPRDLEDLQDKIDGFLDLQLKQWQRRNFSNSMRLRICVEEAIVNAWKHGNKKDPDKGIEIHHRWGNDFHLSIEDQGTGFDVSRLPTPCDKSALTAESGRGIFMIKRSACQVHHNETGTAIYMRLSSRPPCSPVPGGQAPADHQKLPSVWEALKNAGSH